MADRPALTPVEHEDAAVSATMARYLEAIFYIDAEGEPVRAARLAGWLSVAQPTVGMMLQRMATDGLVEVEASKQIHLTPAGRRAASRIVRRHRIAERWLTDVVGLDWASADEEASRLEHAFSDNVANRLYELIGSPWTCPHGNPIPGVEVPDRPERQLAMLAVGERSRVQRISEVAEHEAPDLLRFLGEHGFRLGAEVEMRETNPAGGTVTVLVDDRPVTLSYEVARKVQIAT